uniref:Uncharacterized protein n=1 Tax=Monodelphis domestica TaxID=13616 RepID=A0A5F8GJZ8_MONDO
LVLERKKEIETGVPKSSKGKKMKSVSRDCYISKVFPQGNLIIVVLRNPLIADK